MTMINKGARFLSVALLFMLVGCQKGGQSGNEIVLRLKHPDGQTLVKVGSLNLSDKYFAEDFVSRQGTFLGAPHLNSPEKRQEFVKNQAKQEALLLEALESGVLENDPAIIRDVKKTIVTAYLRGKLQKAQDGYTPTQEEIKTYYDNNQAQFNRGEAVRVTYMMVPYGDNKAKAKELVQKAEKEVRAKVTKGNTKQFSQIGMSLATSSAGKTTVENADSGLIEKEAFETKFGPNLFGKLADIEEIGTVTPSFETTNGYVIFMKTGGRKAMKETLEDASQKISRKLAFEKRGQIYEQQMTDLEKKYSIQIFDDKMEAFNKIVDEASAKAQAERKPGEGAPSPMGGMPLGGAQGLPPGMNAGVVPQQLPPGVAPTAGNQARPLPGTPHAAPQGTQQAKK